MNNFKRLWFVVCRSYLDSHIVWETVESHRGATSAQSAWFRFIKEYAPNVDRNNKAEFEDARKYFKDQGYVARPFVITVEAANRG